jgi:hypothetical protein
MSLKRRNREKCERIKKMYGTGKRMSAREYAEQIVEKTTCGEAICIPLTTKADRETVRLLISGNIKWTGFRIREFYGETIVLERY